MPSSASIERAELRFRQICCQEVAAPLIVPLLFRELHAVVPFASCLYMWLGPSGPIDAYFNVPEVGKYLPLYVDRYFRTVESDVWATTNEAAATQFGPRLLHQVLRISKTAYFRHAIYNEIMLPSNVHTFIRLLIHDGGAPIGTFTISRGPGEREFDEADLRIVQRLEPFIGHAMLKREHASPSCADPVDGEAAMLVADLSGRVRAASPSALRLLSISQGSMLAPPVLPAGLLQTIRKLEHTLRGQAASAVPVWTATNAWGRFTARAYWLDSPDPGVQIGIHLQRKIPRSLKFLDSLHRLRLPPRQEQVALLLALGHSEENAAGLLGLTRNTVVYHRRQIYSRLDIASRASLVRRLSED